MNRQLLNQELGILPLFTRTNNRGDDAHFIPIPRVPLLTYKGPLASDKQVPHDIQVRVSGNMGSRKKEPVEVRAAKWMEANPEIYRRFLEYALKAAERFDHYGAKAVVEQVRFHTPSTDGKPFKIPNAVTTYMAIRFVEEHPQHAGLFSIHKRK